MTKLSPSMVSGNTLLLQFHPMLLSPYVCSSAITLEQQTEVRESSLLLSSDPRSLKDIDSSDLHVTAPLPSEVHLASFSMLQRAANFPRLSTPGH